jgi:hypothetical protein
MNESNEDGYGYGDRESDGTIADTSIHTMKAVVHAQHGAFPLYYSDYCVL